MNKDLRNSLLILGVFAVGGIILGTRKKFKLTKASNCHNKLCKFNMHVNIPQMKVEDLRRAHNTIRSKLQSYFEYQTSYPIPEFYIQGSYKMKTIVENRTNNCDVDLAIVFPSFPGTKLETLQKHVKQALTGHTTKGIVIKEKCVRLNYVRGFHIDLPIYYRGKDKKLYFGSRGEDWETSDPKAFVSWFKGKTKGKPQLVRIIRYLKAFSEYSKTKSRIKMPSGLALTIWAIDNYKSASRDDVSLFYTATNILEYLQGNFKSQWSAKMPVAPHDNVLNRLNGEQKKAFYNELKRVVAYMAEALSSESQKKALVKWKMVFGDRIYQV